nr:NAD(P)-dependent oxidoreductase [Microbacterium bovistercoris]
MTENAPALKNRTIVMSGGSRGIGLAIALRAARDGANIVLLAKTGRPQEGLQGTVYSAAEQIEGVGGRALPIVGDVRSDDDIARVVEQSAATFGGIDVVVNNASALVPASTPDITPKQYDLIQDVNTRGTFMLTRACLPLLRASRMAKVLTLSPPLVLDSPHWLAHFPAYLLSKYGMSLCTLTFAEEFRDADIAVTSLWPRTTIATDAVRNLLGGDAAVERARRPEIVADAAYEILTRDGLGLSGRLLIDEDVLRETGMTDFTRYAADGIGNRLETDFFLDPIMPAP